MDIKQYNGKYVRIKDKWGKIFEGRVEYGNADFLECEWGGKEDGLFMNDFLIYNSDIESIEEIKGHGTIELWTENLILRRYKKADAKDLYERIGKDPSSFEYSGWNPYATKEMAKETVRRFIASYKDEHVYSWVMDWEDILVGTIGAYDYENDQIEVGFTVANRWRGRGFASEALKAVVEYLSENEEIPCITAWCASDNIASAKTLEKAGMRYVRTEKDGLQVGEKTYDRLIYEYRKQS